MAAPRCGAQKGQLAAALYLPLSLPFLLHSSSDFSSSPRSTGSEPSMPGSGDPAPDLAPPGLAGLLKCCGRVQRAYKRGAVPRRCAARPLPQPDPRPARSCRPAARRGARRPAVAATGRATPLARSWVAWASPQPPMMRVCLAAAALALCWDTVGGDGAVGKGEPDLTIAAAGCYSRR